ncbi:MAG: DUF444 family protein [candidate division Zixibacteria bacterium]|nr:DUF444 family protein [candidate division Zixibacteria bacterium]
MNENLTPEQEAIIKRELEGKQVHIISPSPLDILPGIYDYHDTSVLNNQFIAALPAANRMQTIEDLLERDKQREKDGFPRRIRIGKIVKPSKDKKDRIVVVPTTTEPKFVHDNSITEEDEASTGGSGEGEEGEVIGERQVHPEEDGEGQGAGEGSAGEHDVSSDAFDLGKVLTEKFALPNLKAKGKKRSFTKYTYELTDRNRESGQLLDKKETIRSIIKTNILLGNIVGEDEIDPSELVLDPKDKTYRILSKEKDFETQAVVFFIRDYSGSMHGKPTEVIATQHLFIYSWLMYQYKKNVETRFILHDQVAKEVPDFYTYHNSQVAGGTSIYPSYQMVNDIVHEEQLAKDNNIYVFHGTDGDDWNRDGEQAIMEIKKMLLFVNRFGITVAKNAWSNANKTTVETYIDNSKLLRQYPKLVRLDSMSSESADEARIIEGIRRLIGE